MFGWCPLYAISELARSFISLLGLIRTNGDKWRRMAKRHDARRNPSTVPTLSGLPSALGCGRVSISTFEMLARIKKPEKFNYLVEIRKEGNVLFNDALNTFYLRLYGVRHMVKDHSDSERGNPLPPHGLLFPISSKGSFIFHHPTDRITHTTAFVTPVVEHWLEREITQWVHHKGGRN